MTIYTFGTFAHTSLDNGGATIPAGASGDSLTFTVRSLADAAKFGTASTGAGTAFYIWWENEILKVTTGGAGSLSWTALRGQLGTTASAHLDGTAIRETVPGVVFSSFLQGGGFPGEISTPDLKLTGVSGAAASYRLMSATTSGAPTSGTFQANDVVLDPTNHEWWLCTAGGTPGAWVAMGGGGGVSPSPSPLGLASGSLSNPPQAPELEAIIDYPSNVAGHAYLVQDTNTGRHYHVVSDGVQFDIVPTIVPNAGSVSALTTAPSGGWSWFSDPRAIYVNGKTFFGYAADIAGDQSLEVRSYDHATGTVSSPFVLHTTVADSEDHGPPTLLRRASDGRLLTFYHNSDAETVMYSRLSTNPDDVSAWGAQTDITSQVGAGGVRWFFNPLQLTGETNTPIYVFYTQETVAGDPRIVGFTKSTDNGTTWAANTSMYQTSLTWSYFKTAQNGTQRIDFAVTDNHPDRGATSIYHFYYQGGIFYKSDGTVITASLPFDQTALTKVYDGASISGWIWDIAIEPATGHPMMVFATFPSTSDHRYQYARWNGSAWTVNQICTAGGGVGGQPHYSGGVYLDHSAPNVVYASRNITGQWEIWKYTTTDGGTTWVGAALTSSSTNPQLRPMVPRNHAPGLKALWLDGTYTSYNVYSQAIKGTSI